jgi:2-amino-4-hydroxy-6-hydroxymethyldihydropteridine diphosphokinase
MRVGDLRSAICNLQIAIESRARLGSIADRKLPIANPPTPAYIALGANLGDRRANIERALELLRATRGVRVTKISSFLENPAVGGPPDSPPFLNAVAEVETSLPPRALLERLLAIEHQLGRRRVRKWDPRLIDLDVLLYGDAVIDEPDLRIPHPLMHERRFVLDPLKEIAPDAIHPVLKTRIANL